LKNAKEIPMSFDLILPVVLLILGWALVFIEIAVIPGFGLPGIVGGILVAAGVIITWTGHGATWGIVSLVGSIPLFGLAMWLFLKSGLSRRLVQKGVIKGPSSNVALMEGLVGKQGRALTPLRPSGIALIEGTRYDVLSEEGDFIAKDGDMVVTKIETNSIIVRKLNK